MKNKSLFFACIGLGICAGILLVNRFLVPIPDWVAILLMAVAIIFIYFSFRSGFRNKMKRE